MISGTARESSRTSTNPEYKSLKAWTSSLLSSTNREEFGDLVTAMAMQNSSVGIPRQDQEPYFIDMASLLPAACIQITSGIHVKVLDLCAAPGGKSLAILHMNEAKTFTLISSDDGSSNRLNRLRGNLSSWQKVSCSSVHPGPISQVVEASRLSIYGPYQAILLDAPCTSDRHLLEDNFVGWSPKLVTAKAETQRRLISKASSLLMSGGQLVYSTCALSPLENDDVVEYAISKLGLQSVEPSLSQYSGAFQEEIRALFRSSRKTKYGFLCLPHLNPGKCGPIYCAVLAKK